MNKTLIAALFLMFLALPAFAQQAPPAAPPPSTNSAPGHVQVPRAQIPRRNYSAPASTVVRATAAPRPHCAKCAPHDTCWIYHGDGGIVRRSNGVNEYTNRCLLDGPNWR